MFLDNGPAERKSHSRPLRFRGEKRVEDLFDKIGRHATARIGNGHQNFAAILILGVNG